MSFNHLLIAMLFLVGAGCDKPSAIEGSGKITEKNMTQDDAQAVWDDYHRRIRDRRTSEATQLVAAIREDGIPSETALFLDFRHFSSEESDAISLKEQLSENYAVEVTHDAKTDYWFVDGTTRPDGIALTDKQWLDWVEFMADVSPSHGCVFSTWRLTDKSNVTWKSEDFETNSE